MAYLEEFYVLAEELTVLDVESPLWKTARPLLDIALRLEQNDETYTWHGWRKQQINAFLKDLPEHCSLLVGVWQEDGSESGQQDVSHHETLHLGCICEVMRGEVYSIRTFAALTDADLPPIDQLEPGYQHALALMRATRQQVAPVAWALFTEKKAWDEWLFAEQDGEPIVDKGELLISFARQGRCVLMGSRTAHHHI